MTADRTIALLACTIAKQESEIQILEHQLRGMQAENQSLMMRMEERIAQPEGDPMDQTVNPQADTDDKSHEEREADVAEAAADLAAKMASASVELTEEG